MNPSHFVYHRKYIVELWTIEQPFGIHNNSLFYFNIFKSKEKLGQMLQTSRRQVENIFKSNAVISNIYDITIFG